MIDDIFESVLQAFSGSKIRGLFTLSRLVPTGIAIAAGTVGYHQSDQFLEQPVAIQELEEKKEEKPLSIVADFKEAPTYTALNSAEFREMEKKSRRRLFKDLYGADRYLKGRVTEKITELLRDKAALEDLLEALSVYDDYFLAAYALHKDNSPAQYWLYKGLIARESQGHLNAHSDKDAMGVCQFVDGTARSESLLVDLRRGGMIDMRRDPTSIVHCLSHLEDLRRYAQVSSLAKSKASDYVLALAMYNWGPKCPREFASNNLNFGFKDLAYYSHLPFKRTFLKPAGRVTKRCGYNKETPDYILWVLAYADIFAHADDYGLTVRKAPSYASIVNDPHNIKKWTPGMDWKNFGRYAPVFNAKFVSTVGQGRGKENSLKPLGKYYEELKIVDPPNTREVRWVSRLIWSNRYDR